MKKILAILLVGIASSAAASSVSNDIYNGTMCSRLAAENTMRATVITSVVLLQCIALQATDVCNETMCHLLSLGVPVEQSTALTLKSTFYIAPTFVLLQTITPKSTFYIAPKNKSWIIPSYKKDKQLKNVKIRKNGRLQQPKK